VEERRFVTSTVSSTPASEEDEYLGEHHVFEPHRAGLPKMRPYLRELWRRREFARELSRAGMRAAHTDTVFGQVWLVLNPLLLALVYFILVDLLSSGHKDSVFFAHLLSGLFAFYFVAGAMIAGAQSVVAGSRLIMNTAFPRLLLPLSAVRTAFFRFLPTLVVYLVVHLIAGLPIGPTQLLAIPALLLITIFAAGMACFFGVVQVYFRDVSSFLPYFTRIWLYLSPVLVYASQIHAKF
jgi:ABC-type polysaccharide/polyol phosphate export permease